MRILGGSGEIHLFESSEWPSEGATRTGVDAFGEDKVILFSGTTLRLLDVEFELLGEATIESGEPRAILYKDKVIWLAYEGFLLKSNEVFSLDNVTAWEQISLPAGTSVSAFRHYKDGFVILDGGANKKIHVLDKMATVLISWDAPGSNVEKGDVMWTSPGFGFTVLMSMDGAGRRYHFLDDGIAALRGFFDDLLIN